MAGPSADQHEPTEIVFDVTKAIDDVRFLGLLDRSGASGNKLTGLFDWRCDKCASYNRDATLVEPQQAFLSRWVCRHCEQVTIVRFRARASAEWVAEHALAITGKALCHLAENELVAAGSIVGERPRKQRSQRLFAWIAIPALTMLVILGLSDMRRLAHSSAALKDRGALSAQAGATSRLPGSWLSENGTERLTFSHVDPVSLRGSGVYFPERGRPGERFWFDVTHEDVRGEQVNIRPCREDSGQGSEVTIYMPANGGSLTWIDIESGRPIFKVYRRAED